MPRSQEGLARLIDRDRLDDDRITAAFRSIDRKVFVPSEFRARAYEDRPVGIPAQQTTSQPSLIARMIDAARVPPGGRALEVGTGYGFQTALLARLCREVYSIERHPELAAQAESNLRAAGINNATVTVGDGWAGWPEHAPYDAIVVSAAASEVPDALRDQLAEGGRLVIPVTEGASDNVYLFVKTDGATRLVRLLTPARFVPLVKEPPS
jgi:protein-L-isoaspartate(D-aspartate) O-methyltransferase